MECGLVLEPEGPELDRLLQPNQKDYDAVVHESIMDCSAEIDLKERELDLLRMSIKEYRTKREAQISRIQELDKLIDDRSKSLDAKEKQIGSLQCQLSLCCRDINAKEREYGAIQQRVEERGLELEAMGEALKSVEKQVREGERNRRLKEDECNWHLETMHRLIRERDEVLEKMQRAVEACGVNLGAKESRLRVVEGLIREREQELEAKEVKLHNIHRDCECKEEGLRKLSVRMADCNKELRAKEEELDSVQRLIDAGKGLEFKRRILLKSMQAKINQLVKEKQRGGQGEELKAKERKFEERVKEFESKEKQFEGRMKELELREEQIEGKAKELESNKKQFMGRMKEFETKEKELEELAVEFSSIQKLFKGQMTEFQTKQELFSGQLKALMSKEKNLEVQEKMLKAKEKQFEARAKELESKEKEFERRVEDLESQKSQYVGKMKAIELKKAMLNGQLEGQKSKEKQMEAQMKEIESKRNRYEENLKELESKEAQFRLALKKLESEEKQFEGRRKDLQSKQSQLGRQQKELEIKEKQCESLRKTFEEELVLKEKSNILLHQVKVKLPEFTDTNSVSNCKNLQLLFNLLKKFELVCSQVSDALQTSADPSKMVLATIKGFCSPQLRHERDVISSRRIRNLLMDELKKSSSVISSHVKQDAMQFASDWKASIAVADTGCLEVLDFLKFIATYEIGFSFNQNELQSLLDIISQHCQSPKALGNIEELPDFVQNFIKKKQYIEAARSICAYKLADKINPVGLLRLQVVRANRLLGNMSGNNPIEEKLRCKDIEICILGKVLQCISDNNLGSQDLVNEIQDRILFLESAVTINQVKGQQPEAQKPADGAVTLDQDQVQQPVENTSTNEAVTVNQVQVQQPQEKKRPIEAVPDNHHLHQSPSGYDNKRPRTDASPCLPRVFTSHYQHSVVPSEMPAQFGLPPHYYDGVTGGNSEADYFCYPKPYPPFR